MTRRFPASLMVVLIASLCGGGIASSQDRIHLKRKGFQDVFPTSGEVLEFTGRIVRYKVRSEVREEPADTVERIETSYPPAFSRGQQQFQQGQYQTAREDWNEALRAEPREWVKREIRSWLVRCDLRLGDWTAAVQEFSKIIQTDPHTPYWSVAPLTWTPTPAVEADRATARALLNDRSPVARLLGASRLLTDGTHGEAAAAALDELARDPAPFVGPLARAQLWRRLTGVAIRDSELASWKRTIDALPEALRGGPRYQIARARLTRSEFDLAAAEFLWVATIDNQHEPTAARASLDAAEALVRAGRPGDAVTVFRETLTAYPWSPVAADARSRLNELDPPAPSDAKSGR